MNIMMLDVNPRQCARYYPDRLVAAVLRDTACVLSAAHVQLDGLPTAKARVGLLLPPYYLPVYTAHAITGSPWARWAALQRANYGWLHQLMHCLTQEFYQRWHRAHAFELVAEHLVRAPLNVPAGAQAFTLAPQCMPAQYKRASTVEAYRLYFAGEKRALAQWTPPARVPAWYAQLTQEHAA